MPLHPEVERILRTLPPTDGTPPDPAAVRAAENEHLPAPEDRLPMHSVEDAVAQASVGEIPVRIYTPAEAEAYDLLVYFHGGAFFSGGVDSHDGIARALAKETGCRVISVGYRLAPDAAYPAGLDDCYAVVRWAAENGGILRWSGERLAVAGDSSGGNFAAAVAARAHDDGFNHVTHQILLYPSLDLDFNVERYASLRENAHGYGLETAGLKPWNSFYFDSGADAADPLVSPIKRADLTGLPSALLITAEFDPLRDEGELYGERLKEAGVDVDIHRYEEAGHGFVQHFSWIPEFYDAFREAGDFMRRRP
jgi:acetyl esterase